MEAIKDVLENENTVDRKDKVKSEDNNTLLESKKATEIFYSNGQPSQSDWNSQITSTQRKNKANPTKAAERDLEAMFNLCSNMNPRKAGYWDDNLLWHSGLTPISTDLNRDLNLTNHDDSHIPLEGNKNSENTVDRSRKEKVKSEVNDFSIVDLLEMGNEDIIDAFKEMKEELDALKTECAQEKKKYDDLTSSLRAKLECPVCLDVPTSGPVPVCSNGHFVCSGCKQNLCPTCRVNMFNNKSLLAITVIEKIEHKCKHEGCSELLPLADLETHMKTCVFRIISCPAPSEYCGKKVAFCEVLKHVLYACKGSKNATTDGEVRDYKTMPVTITYCTTEGLPFNNFGMPGVAFQWNEKFFFLNRETGLGGDGTVFGIQLLGNDEDCRGFAVDIAVHKIEDGDIKGKFVQKISGEPLPIDIEESHRKRNGLVVSSFNMRKMASWDDDKWKIDVTFNIK